MVRKKLSVDGGKRVCVCVVEPTSGTWISNCMRLKTHVKIVGHGRCWRTSLEGGSLLGVA